VEAGDHCKTVADCPELNQKNEPGLAAKSGRGSTRGKSASDMKFQADYLDGILQHSRDLDPQSAAAFLDALSGLF
jgi:hypothetical protein